MRIGDIDFHPAPGGRTRREVIRTTVLAAMAVPVAACDPFDRDRQQPPPPDPLAPLIAGALELATRYEAAVTAHPELADRLTPIATAHRTHAVELSRVTGTGTPDPGVSATATPPVGGLRAAVAELRSAEQTARETATRICTEVPADRAALVGSIAAARASHLEVLRWAAAAR